MFIDKLKPKLIGNKYTQIIAILLYLNGGMITEEYVSEVKQGVFVLATFLIKLVITMAISYGIQALTAKKPPKPQHAKPAGLEQFDVPTAEEGRPIPVLFGKKQLSGPNIIWYGAFKTLPIIRRM